MVVVVIVAFVADMIDLKTSNTHACIHTRIHREQFRVFGTIQVVTHAETDKALQGQRKHQWGCLSDNAKVSLWFDFV